MRARGREFRASPRGLDAARGRRSALTCCRPRSPANMRDRSRGPRDPGASPDRPGEAGNSVAALCRCASGARLRRRTTLSHRPNRWPEAAPRREAPPPPPPPVLPAFGSSDRARRLGNLFVGAGALSSPVSARDRLAELVNALAGWRSACGVSRLEPCRSNGFRPAGRIGNEACDLSRERGFGRQQPLKGETAP